MVNQVMMAIKSLEMMISTFTPGTLCMIQISRKIAMWTDYWSHDIPPVIVMTSCRRRNKMPIMSNWSYSRGYLFLRRYHCKTLYWNESL